MTSEIEQKADAALAVPRGRRIDSHMHLWTLGEGRYPWLTPDFGPLYATWTPEQAEPELAAAGMAGAILVQAEDSEADTTFMLDIADRHSWVLGVVGWIDLTDPDAAAEQLDRWHGNSAFCGIRHLLNDDPRDLLGDDRVIASLSEVARRGLAFDLHDSWPRFLPETAALADRVPELSIIIDHVGNAPRGQGDYSEWMATIAKAAQRENVSAKLSSLRYPGQPFSVDAVREVRDHALDCFGADRLMYGGDWPMPVAEGGYPATWGVMAQLIGELAEAEQNAILRETACRIYGQSTRLSALRSR
ncbi:amidohydrolase family protein [Paramicrobacterium fandaimingii]|uniref:amidohydrolase family protein n=1 Tax=Paramicrobacterium fandaimingii TaxID=2708079 RepID=UPI0014247A0A|nr:amidohydrolase family protein [Microbacterium fandaimingii]